jgi:hypothetical protein
LKKGVHPRFAYLAAWQLQTDPGQSHIRRSFGRRVIRVDGCAPPADLSRPFASAGLPEMYMFFQRSTL